MMGDSDDDARARFNRLFDDYAGIVREYALRRVARSEVDDVVSETFVVAWRRLDAVPDDALPWLLGVARRVLGEERRAALRRDRLRERLAAEIPSSPADSGEPGNEGQVLAALAALPARDRELVLLVCWEGLSSRDAAAVVGCTPVAARLRLHRARRRLAAMIARSPSPTPLPLDRPERT
jgi:RNA polymerase sigma-70 factor, ECF subfamily